MGYFEAPIHPGTGPPTMGLTHENNIYNGRQVGFKHLIQKIK